MFFTLRTLRTRHDRQGKVEKAKEMMADVSRQSEATLGPTHHSTLLHHFNLADVVFRHIPQDRDVALRSMEAILQTFESQLGSADSTTAIARDICRKQRKGMLT